MPITETTPFECPNCAAQYKLVRIETNETLPDQQLAVASAGDRFTVEKARSSSNTFWWIVPGVKRNALAHHDYSPSNTNIGI